MKDISYKGLNINPTELETPSLTNHAEVHDFYWTKNKQFHNARRLAMIKKYPEITKLMGPEPLTKYIVLMVVLTQTFIAIAFKNTNFWNWKFLMVAWCIGGSLNQNCFLAIHELSHNLAFKKPIFNKALSIIAGLPSGVPVSGSFNPYHQLHHKFLGDEIYDTDVPTKFEAKVLSNFGGKLFFLTFQILFYALRPGFLTSVPITLFQVFNVLACICYDLLMTFKWGSFNSFAYLIISSLFAGCFHPTSGHFIAEHYLFDEAEAIKGGVQALKFTEPDSVLEDAKKDYLENYRPQYAMETFSYYGPWNIFVWNAGWHLEHHDFPYIAWTRVNKLHEIAPEFYLGLPHHTSWVKVLWDFLFTKDVTLYSRVKRVNYEKRAMKKKN
ncbi:related to putative fatty acid desaturase (mld) [Saccharomycodes ludwigii]|uniref:Related to putative fatty acid desaturase (Mld) n=1 Tax=Saccharomycodes ludwigii TaxID=36035 RepID=A0A376B6T3_9ASCO|nr:conserved putative dihydroceramide delta(4)-desaturase [Saccharomycodes ludwigii]KAH3902428.1 conserved putative dihydroceramide delta(4)-desaturase [Saccharomycodes ludwigii]SSD60417.1 related to putative fatty acid desaturase (mld) [Saccharomycodes ludwigii]